LTNPNIRNTISIYKWKSNGIKKKNRANVLKHGFDFRDAIHVFEGPKVTFYDDRYDYGEDRYITLGLLGDIIIFIGHTYRGDKIRVISMRKAIGKERRIYEKKVFLGHGKD